MKRVIKTCKECVHFEHRPRRLKTIKGKIVEFVCSDSIFGRRSSQAVCARFRPKVCGECAHYIVYSCPVYSDMSKLTPMSPACPRFLDRSILSPIAADPTLSSEELEERFKKKFSTLLQHIFAFEKASVKSVEDIFKTFESQGIYVPFNQAAYDKIINWLTKFYLIKRGAEFLGIPEYADTLIRYELDLAKTLAAAGRRSQK